MPGNLQGGETDDPGSVYPFWGRFNYSFWGRLNYSPIPNRRVLHTFVRREHVTLWWILGLALSCVCLAVALFERGYGMPSASVFLVLAGVTAIAERQSVRVARNVETSVAFLPFVFTAIAYGPLAALAVGLVANALDFRRPYLRWAIYIPVRGLTGALTGVAAAEVMSDRASFARMTAATVVAGLANITFDGAFNVSTLLVRRSAPITVFVRSVGPFALLSLPLYVPLVALMVYVEEHYSFWPAAMFLAPTVALQRVVHLYQRQRDVSEELGLANERLEATSISFAAALVATLDARDRYTAGHSASVATYARDIAERLGLAEEDQRLAHICGLVHDVGKVGLPAGLLEKPGPLSLEERRHMERHPVIGERILEHVADYKKIASIVRHHHERVDGQGYPDGLRGEDIPLVARILAVADAYDAMISHRPYREAMHPRVARLRMAQAVGSQFDTSVVAAFEAILAQAPRAYLFGEGPEFVFKAGAELEEVKSQTFGDRPAVPRLQAQVS